jgi:chaperone modulatory protein CbpM
LLEDACLTREDVARACAVTPEWVRRHVEEGLLTAIPDEPVEWRCTSALLRRVRRMAELERDFDAAPELAALMVDLLEEIDALRARLRRAGLE